MHFRPAKIVDWSYLSETEETRIVLSTLGFASPQQLVKRFYIYWFDKVRRTTGFLRPFDVLGLPPSSQGDNEDVPAERHLANVSRRIVTVQFRHADIHQNDLRAKFGRDFDRLQAVTGRADLVTFRTQQEA
jgi:hypothetical protein